MNRLKRGVQLSDYRTLQTLKQANIDPITGLEILDPALDHDHASGKVRAVLDKRTNAWEGKVKNSFIRCGLRKIGADYISCLRNLADYLEQDYSRHPYHPDHKTADERRLTRNKRARKKRATKKSK